MFGRLVLGVVAVFGCVWESVCAEGGQEVFLESLKEVSQEEAELILHAETTLRHYFIRSLANLREEIVESNFFRSVVDEILQGLRSRDLNPLKSFENGYSFNSDRSPAYQMATLIRSLQSCDLQESVFNDWHSFLQEIPNIETIPEPPNIYLTSYHLQKVNSRGTPFVTFVLLAIRHNRLTPTATLLRHLLYNFRYKNYFPDLDVVVQSLNISQPPLKADPTAVRPNEILFALLKSLPKQHDSVLAFQTSVLLSALSDAGNVDEAVTPSSWEVFSLIGDDDYPPDIVRAATELSAAVKNQQINIDRALLLGYSPLEQLLSVIAQLLTVPNTNSLGRKVHAIYPHVKLKFLSCRQKFFHPRTSLDIAFLLNSFLTTSRGILIKEIYRIFLLPRFNWQKNLENFDYSKYSKPRPLLLDMLRVLLRQSNELPSCDLTIFNVFLRKSGEMENCPPQKIADELLNEIPNNPIIPVFSEQETSPIQNLTHTFHISADPKLNYSQPQALEILLDQLSDTTKNLKLLLQREKAKSSLYTGQPSPALVSEVLPENHQTAPTAAGVVSSRTSLNLTAVPESTQSITSPVTSTPSAVAAPSKETSFFASPVSVLDPPSEIKTFPSKTTIPFTVNISTTQRDPSFTNSLGSGLITPSVITPTTVVFPLKGINNSFDTSTTNSSSALTTTNFSPRIDIFSLSTVLNHSSSLTTTTFFNLNTTTPFSDSHYFYSPNKTTTFAASTAEASSPTVPATPYPVLNTTSLSPISLSSSSSILP